MPATLRDVHARVAAAKVVLAGAAGSDSHTSLSSIQCSALRGLMSDISGIESEAWAKLSDEIEAVNWAPGDLQQLLQHIASAAAGGVKKLASRKTQQNYCSMLGYGSEMLWSALSDELTPPENKLHLLVLHLTRLGLRSGTEHTIKFLNSWWLLMSHDPSSLLRMDTTSKLVSLNHVKSVVRGLVKGLQDPDEWIETLPDAPTEFLQKYPRMYNDAFGAGHPVTARVNLQQLLALDSSYGCRGGLKRVIPSSVPPQSFQQHQQQMFTMQPQQQHPGELMIQMMQSFMDRMMPAMPNNRALPLQLPGSSGSSSSHGISPDMSMQLGSSGSAGSAISIMDVGGGAAAKKPACLAGLAAAPAPKRLTTVSFESPTTAAETPPLEGVVPLPSSSACGAVAEAEAVSTGAVAPPAGAAAPPHILDLYDAIQGRKDDKDKPPIMKRPAAAISEAEREGGEDVVVGCSKCRWSAGGCAKCRDPDFAGRRWNPNA